MLEEPESDALRRMLAGRPDRASSALARVEVHLAAARRQPAPPAGRVEQVLGGLVLLAIDETILDSAVTFGRRGLRTLDAIHVASAAALGGDLDALVAYDERLLVAAAEAGLATSTPS